MHSYTIRAYWACAYFEIYQQKYHAHSVISNAMQILKSNLLFLCMLKEPSDIFYLAIYIFYLWQPSFSW